MHIGAQQSLRRVSKSTFGIVNIGPSYTCKAPGIIIVGETGIRVSDRVAAGADGAGGGWWWADGIGGVAVWRVAGERFPMGCATAASGGGIVGGHAYSLLEAREVDGRAGRQQRISDFTGASLAVGTTVEADYQGGGVWYGGHITAANADGSFGVQYGDGDFEPSVLRRRMRPQSVEESSAASAAPLRMCKVRNPWGRVEWQGAFGAKSAAWSDLIEYSISLVSVEFSME